MAGIYFHIPFCKQACYYCDFHFSTNQSKRAEIVEAMCKEVYLQRNYLEGGRIESIYFGGGTPSLLHPAQLELLLRAIRDHHEVSPGAEVTLEANPDDLNKEYLSAIRAIGINRLSIGIQSFHDDVLRFLNRAHNAADAKACVQLARQAGFTNISIDLIYAIPGQAEAVWRENVEQAIALNPEHISAYSLTIEPKTVFGKWSKQGKLPTPTDEKAATEFEILTQLLTKNKYDHYEVSNFAKPNFYSRHNSSYWKQQKYLGIGPSAHSYNGASRQYNVSNNHLYLKSLHNKIIPCEVEQLSVEDHVNEFLLTTLRTSWGCDLKFVKHQYNIDLIQMYDKYLLGLTERRLATIENGVITLTATGRLLADKISSDLFLVR